MGSLSAVIVSKIYIWCNKFVCLTIRYASRKAAPLVTWLTTGCDTHVVILQESKKEKKKKRTYEGRVSSHCAKTACHGMSNGYSQAVLPIILLEYQASILIKKLVFVNFRF